MVGWLLLPSLSLTVSLLLFTAVGELLLVEVIMVLFLVVGCSSESRNIFVNNDPFDKRLKMGLF